MDQPELRQQLTERFPRERTHLLPALHYVQRELGHLPEWALQVVGWHLRVPAGQVYGAATSYTDLRVARPGGPVVRVCTGLSCWLNGAGKVLDAARQTLDVAPGGPVTLEERPCAFLCALAPAAEVDGRLAGRLDPDRVRQLLLSLDASPDDAG